MIGLVGPALVVPVAARSVPVGRDRVVRLLVGVGLGLAPLAVIGLALPLLLGGETFANVTLGGGAFEGDRLPGWLPAAPHAALGLVCAALGAHLVYWRPPRLRLEPLALHVGLLAVVVTSFWLGVRHRVVTVADVDPATAATAAAHVQFAGTGTLVLCALASRRIGRLRELYRWRVWIRLAALLTLLALVPVAVAPVAPHLLGGAATTASTASALLVGLCLFRLGRDPRLPTPARLLLTLSALLTAVSLAVLWGSSAPRAPLFHGAVHAVGVVGAGLLGLRAADRDSLVHDPTVDLTTPPRTEPVRTPPGDAGPF